VTTEEFITELFCRVDDAMVDVHKHPQSTLYPSEMVTLAFLFAIKGVGNRSFYRWIRRDCLSLFPHLPDRTRLFRLFKVHKDWTDRFLAEPTIFGVIDSYGIEMIHPYREGRSKAQVGRKGLSNHRWIVGGKLCLLLNKLGLVVDWASDTANVSDQSFQSLVEADCPQSAEKVSDQMIVFADKGFHKKEGDPANLKICKPRQWNDRMLANCPQSAEIETVFSMQTLVCHLKKVAHRVWAYFEMHLAFALAAFNVLVQWHGLPANADGFVPLSIAQFSL